MSDKKQTRMQTRRAAAEFLNDFLVEAQELRLSEASRIDPVLNGLVDQTVVRHLESGDLEDLLSSMHGFPRLRDRARELAVYADREDDGELRRHVMDALHVFGWPAKLTFLAEHLGLAQAVEEISRLLGIDEVSKTRILYERLNSHAPHMNLEWNGAAGA